MNELMNHILSLRDHCKNDYIVEKPSIKLNYNSAIFLENKHKIGKSSKNKIIFEKGDTLKTAIKYEKNNPLILIFADDIVPGGTWISSCQEETLFRRSALYAHLPETMYPIDKRDLLLAYDVPIYNTEDDFKLYDYNVLYKFNFVALPCVRNYNGEEDLYLILKDKIRLLYQTCIINDYDTLILGALGCGAYGCNAENVAKVFKEVQDEYENCDLTIIYSFIGSIGNIFIDVLNK